MATIRGGRGISYPFSVILARMVSRARIFYVLLSGGGIRAGIREAYIPVPLLQMQFLTWSSIRAPLIFDERGFFMWVILELMSRASMVLIRILLILLIL